MKASLVFFDSQHESAYGTLRGLLAIVPLVVMYYILSLISKTNFPFGWWSVVFMLIMCSALGVIIPEDLKQSVFFGACVGAVMFGAVAFFECPRGTEQKCDLYEMSKRVGILISAGICIGIIANIIVYYAYWKNEKMKTLLNPVTSTKNIIWQLGNGVIFAALIVISIFLETDRLK